MKSKYGSLRELMSAISAGNESLNKIKVWVGSSVNIWEWNPDAENEYEAQGERLVSMGDAQDALIEALNLMGFSAEIP
jgi:hypothetical protein